MSEPLFAIDSSVYIFRSYFALEPRWQSRQGRPTETVYGFSAFLLKLLRQELPAYIAAAFDESLGSGFRHRLYPDYKANRELPDDNLAFQLDACKQVASVLGIPVFACEEYEADDYLATLATRAAGDRHVYILSRDKDLAQLLSDSVSLWDYGYGDKVSSDAYQQTKGLAPRLVADLLALMGDTSDNIPGVPGVGLKTATAILSRLGGIDEWIDSPEKLSDLPIRGARTLPEKILPYRGQIELAKQLTLLRKDLTAVPPLAELCWRGVDEEQANELFEELGLNGLKKRLADVVNLSR